MIKIKLTYNVSEKDNGKKVGNIIREKFRVSSRLLTKLKMNGKIQVNNINVFSSYIVHENDKIEVNIDFEEKDNIIPEKMNLNILYEDEYILAINKIAGMVVHPSANHLNNTLANGVKYYLNNNKKIRAINRIDKDTSGIVLFAKNEYIQELMIKENSIKKEYVAIVLGKLRRESEKIIAPIARKQGSIMEREVNANGQVAITNYENMGYINDKNISFVHVELETGRTHQIRVHMAYIGNPILGDTLYGEETDLIDRQALHAYRSTFIHPITKKEIILTAPIPFDMSNLK